jgi:zinc D-Ala-D-Ala carboxypeptidase
VRLTTNFCLEEFLRSTSMPNFADKIHVPESVIENLYLLCALGLEPIRKRFGPVIITSGYRTPALNEKVGGADGSRHLLGMAADYRVPSAMNGEVYEYLKYRGWSGENILYPSERRMHIALPRFGHESVTCIKGG